MRGRRAVFLDRDGTLVRDVGYLSDPDAVELLPGTAAALRSLRDGQFDLYVATNQSGIGRGYFGRAAVEAVNARVLELLEGDGARVDGVYVCPHAPIDGCGCRKPRPGMLVQAAGEHGVDITRSVMVGDSSADVHAGRAAGCRTVLLGDGPSRASADFVAPNLLEASSWILGDG